MANQEHFEILKQGTDAWNTWRKQHPKIRPDLSRANLRDANLRDANLRLADLTNADLTEAILIEADLTEAILIEADLSRADLDGANLTKAKLIEADLSRANLGYADLSYADLSYADLSGATLVETNLSRATLTECYIYGISVWNVRLEGAKQDNLAITQKGEPTITVDNLEVAQFIYLLLNNPKIRDVIDTIAKKAVLILGRFAPERKAVLDALRGELRRRDYLPILFDFKKPSSRNLTETVSTLAHLSRFIIADLTDPRSIPNELRAIIPILRVPVQPLLNVIEEPYGMFEDFRDYPWVLPTHRYTDLDSLLATLKEQVIDPAEQKAQELTQP